MTENSHICNFIKNNSDWYDKLTSYPYFIHIKESNDLCIFNYSLTEAFNATNKDEEFIARIDFSIPEVQEARGIIINVNTCEVVCWPFRKFGNYGESYADNINWKTACVQEKIDGSIMKLWFDKRSELNQWRLSTNGVINAFECKNQYGVTYGDLFNEAAQKQNLDLNKLSKDYTYIFEIIGPFNRVVIEYPETKIIHTGTRNNITGEEIDANIGIEKPLKYPISTLENCIEAASKLNIREAENRFNVQKEGFVVVDENWNRIKIKSPEYVAVHHAFNGGILSKKRAVSMILENEDEEYLTYFPEYKEFFDLLKVQMQKTVDMIESYCKESKEISLINNYTVKDFAINFNKDKLKTYAIEYIFKNKSLEEVSHRMTRKGWLRWIDNIDDYDFNKENPTIKTMRTIKNKEEER